MNQLKGFWVSLWSYSSFLSLWTYTAFGGFFSDYFNSYWLGYSPIYLSLKTGGSTGLKAYGFGLIGSPAFSLFSIPLPIRS